MSHSIEVLEGAFIVSDAHYSNMRPELLDFIKDIHSKKLKPTQLILMGDIFDALFGGVFYTQKINTQVVKLINEISKDVEVIYLEGNHDFNLKKIFPQVKIFPISLQPVTCDYNGKKILLAHGDIESDFGYRIYTSMIRNHLIVYILNIIDTLSGHYILKKLDKHLSKKNDCKEFTGFTKYISDRLEKKYSCDCFIEGHFHQNRTMILEKFTYINLGAFACNQRYFIVKSAKEPELLQEKIFSKGN
ncbi:UDP-2,3-diacylglucosamine diphosphatase [Candidatus Sulfurimonas baltica]|uniref:Metallophosphoesterase n=1 Tax=Candidatus Sulfurimonas baltica TaxID=2740404 RepID=A0A7S7LWA1_9BACT|nr:metallophosphoesterase [Candidatus Sulfurimonas baltica]QOY52580.1 metallophosphoesterase [Candidatus Sulfurimonas baltica]